MVHDANRAAKVVPGSKNYPKYAPLDELARTSPILA